MDMIDKTPIGFKYKFLHYGVDGKLKNPDEDWVNNLIPNEGRDYILNAALNLGAAFGAWYVGIYSANYAPVASNTAANFPALATEITTAYSEATRPSHVDDTLAAGLWANSVAPAIFTFTASATVFGGFITSSATKGGTTGVLLSAVLASTSKTLLAGESLKVVTGLSFATV